MPKFKFDEIEVQTSKGRLFPVYLIYGAESYLIRLLIEKIQEVYRAETGAEIERHSAQGLDAVSVVDGLNTIPMWSKGRLVIISEAGSLSQKSKDLLADYAESPSKSSILLLSATKFDGRSRLCKAAAESGAVVEIAAIYSSQMPYWINRECKKMGAAISQDAARFMTELIGTDLSAMSSAVEKIILYTGKKKTIDLGDVEKVLSDTSQKSIFDLTNAVGSKDLLRAENRLVNLLRYNESPVVVVNMLARHVRLLLHTKNFMERKAASERDLAQVLGVHPFFVKDYINQSKNFTKRQLALGIKSLWRADVAVKSSRLPKETILYRLVYELIKG